MQRWISDEYNVTVEPDDATIDNGDVVIDNRNATIDDSERCDDRR